MKLRVRSRYGLALTLAGTFLTAMTMGLAQEDKLLDLICTKQTFQGLNLRYPTRYKPEAIPGWEKTGVFLVDQELKTMVLYVVALGKNPDAAPSITAVRAQIPAVLGQTRAPFEWKSKGKATPHSVYDKQPETFWGFDGHVLLEFETHKLKLPAQTVLVGYGTYRAKGREAERLWKGRGSPSSFPLAAIQDCTWLVSGITGEKPINLGGVSGDVIKR